MPQAVSRHIMPRSRGHIPSTTNGKTDVKGLIAAHRQTKAAHNAASSVVAGMHYPDSVSVTIPEIGPHCAVYTIKDLERFSREHIANNGLTGLDRITFQKQMVGYREALTLLDGLRQEWRGRQKIDEIEAVECKAYDEAEKAWKALLARIHSHPKDIPEIARYFATPEASTGDFWRPREVLRAIAAAHGRGTR